MPDNSGASGPRPTDAIEAEIRRLASALGEGVFGVHAQRLDSRGPAISVNGDEPFPMASTSKVALAGKIFAEVDAGKLALSDMVEIARDNLVESPVIADHLIHPGVALSVFNLLELTLTLSDNTATDALMAVAGGGETVTTWLREQGITGQQVNRDTATIFRDFLGLPPGPFSPVLADARKQNEHIDRIFEKPNPQFDDDPRDCSTPRAMSQLLGRIFRGEALSEESTSRLVAIMGRCRTGGARLKGRMPPQTHIAEKTGTIGGTVNDVGVISLPGEAGHVVVSAFIKKSERNIAENEALIADVSRSIRDFYLFYSF